MKHIQINIQSAILKSIRSFISVIYSSAYCSKIIKSSEYLELNYKRYTYLGIKQRRTNKMKFRLNPERFSIFSGSKRSDKIEQHIEKSKGKFFWSNVFKTKTQALFEQIEGYYARNKEYHKDLCNFNTYVQHWTEAHRGVIQDIYLDMIEKSFGVLEGPLYVVRGHSSWDTRSDHRNDPRPSGGSNE